jgi:hypothetical protein
MQPLSGHRRHGEYCHGGRNRGSAAAAWNDAVLRFLAKVAV